MMSPDIKGQKLRIAVLISGRGSNLAALIKACKDPDFPAEIALVISNRADAKGLALAQAEAIDSEIIRHKDYPNREQFDSALTHALKRFNIELVCLAGFMRILSEKFVDCWAGDLINIHPSLLPAYKGLDVHQRMIDDGVRVAGCTVHYVTAQMDAGPIIGQRSVPVLAEDTPDILAERILMEEHLLYPDCVRKIANERLQRVGST